jgi:hypothetical protein
MLIMQRKTPSGFACMVELNIEQRLQAEQWLGSNSVARTVPFKGLYIVTYQHMDWNEQHAFMHSMAFFYQIDLDNLRQLRQFALWATFTNIVIVSATHEV